MIEWVSNGTSIRWDIYIYFPISGGEHIQHIQESCEDHQRMGELNHPADWEVTRYVG